MSSAFVDVERARSTLCRFRTATVITTKPAITSVVSSPSVTASWTVILYLSASILRLTA